MKPGLETVPPPQEIGVPCFLADRMVGKLARWLRILGYDTICWPQLSPDALFREGGRQGRIILTRDTRLLRRKDPPPLIFIDHDHFREQLIQVVHALHLNPVQRLLSRCIECNQELATVAKDDIRARVPEYVWQTQHEFHRCPQCHRLYWGATHRAQVLAELERMGLVRDTNL